MRLTTTGEVRVYRVPLVGRNLDRFIEAMAERAPSTRIQIIAPAQLPYAKAHAIMKQLVDAGLRDVQIVVE